MGFFRRHLLVGLAVLLTVGVAQAISYTVQVVALSDQEAALALQRQLLLDGFPAYVIRTSTAQGDIFRLRVGAFANRQAALVYAETMPEIAGSRPVPALAESIPEGVMPVEPRVLTRIDGATERFEVLGWNDTIAIRRQPLGGLRQARYEVAGEDGLTGFDAWRAVPVGDGRVVRVRDLALWPDSWRDDDAEARDIYRTQRVSLIATSLGLSLETVLEAEVQGEDRPPFLLVAERFDPASPGSGTILALGLPDTLGATGPTRFAGASGGELEAASSVPDVLFVGEPGSADPAPGTVAAADWRATADGSFVRLEFDPGSRAWRAAVGTPLWGDGRFLLTSARGAYLLYDFVPR